MISTAVPGFAGRERTGGPTLITIVVVRTDQSKAGAAGKGAW